jgi:plastocyanin
MNNTNQQNENSEPREEDFSYAVMPTANSAYTKTDRPVSDIRTTPDQMGPGSFWQSKTTYIIVGVLVLITLGALAYFLLAPSKEKPQEQASTKLPKVFLQRYFNVEVCVDTGVCGDTADSDQDGLQNYDEFVAQTDPTLNDSDADSLADGDEVNVYLTEPLKKFTDSRPVSQQGGYTDGSQIKNGYDPLTPGLKMTQVRLDQIKEAILKYGLHEPTVTLMAQPLSKTVNINIVNNKFEIASITIAVNDSVVWINKDSSPHQIASDPHPAHTSLPDLASGSLATNQTYSYKFTAAGTYTYHDHLNPNIKGTIIVQ